jgi:hypothetical protein
MSAHEPPWRVNWPGRTARHSIKYCQTASRFDSSTMLKSFERKYADDRVKLGHDYDGVRPTSRTLGWLRGSDQTEKMWIEFGVETFSNVILVPSDRPMLVDPPATVAAASAAAPAPVP